MTEQEWLVSVNPDAMFRVASGFRSNCCGCRWLNHSDGTCSMFSEDKCCPRCDNEPWLDGHTRLVSDRKLRLFALACVFSRHSGEVGEQRRKAYSVAEKMADSSDTVRVPRNLRSWNVIQPSAVTAAQMQIDDARMGPTPDTNWAKAAARLRDIIGNPWRPVTRRAEYRECCGRRWLNTTGPQYCPRCGDLAGCGVMLHPWITQLTAGIASEAYEHRNDDGSLCSDRLGVLSDALEDAACPADEVCQACDGAASVRTNYGNGGYSVEPCKGCCAGRIPHPLLAHLRSPGSHYRGMWSLDVVLGKE